MGSLFIFYYLLLNFYSFTDEARGKSNTWAVRSNRRESLLNTRDVLAGKIESNEPFPSYKAENKFDINEQNISSINEFVDFQQENTFLYISTCSDTIAKSAFGAASVLTYALFDSGTQDVSRTALIKEKLGQLNAKIDEWIDELYDAKEVIDWHLISIDMEGLQYRIIDLYKMIGNISMMEKAYRKRGIERFITNYESGYGASGDILYSLLVNTKRSHSDNLFRACQKFSENNRFQVQKFMVRMSQLLSQAMFVEAVYFIWKYDSKDSNNYIRSLWENKFLNLRKTMEELDREIKNNFAFQFKTDLDHLLETRHSLTNAQFCQVVYDKFSRKYFWREWFVLVYAPITGFKDHAVVTCQGIHRFRKYGRNVILSSVDQDEAYVALNHTERNTNVIGSYKDWNSDREYSKGWVTFMGKELPNCNDADTRVSVVWGSDVWYMRSDLIIYKKNCVYDKSPCYNTFLFA